MNHDDEPSSLQLLSDFDDATLEHINTLMSAIESSTTHPIDHHQLLDGIDFTQWSEEEEETVEPSTVSH
jgi:hypothetical protein